MGGYGPVPKRSEERIRRNKPDVEITRIEAMGEVVVPDLGFYDPHPIVQDLWDSLPDSGQAKYYEPSDWEFARFVLHFADGLLKSERPSAQLFQGVSSALSDLLVSEGARRRVRMEVERHKAKAKVIDVSEEIRKRMFADQ